MFTNDTSLRSDVREESHETRTLCREREGALLLGWESGAAIGRNLAVRSKKHFDELNIFVVDVLNIIRRKIVLLFFHDIILG